MQLSLKDSVLILSCLIYVYYVDNRLLSALAAGAGFALLCFPLGKSKCMTPPGKGRANSLTGCIMLKDFSANYENNLLMTFFA